MARIRTIKPEFFTDEKVGWASTSARLLFIGMWCFADDAGSLAKSVPQLRAQVFPFDDLKLADVEGLLQELLTSGLVVEYEVEGRRYLHIPGFKKHQLINRPSRSQCPGYADSLRTHGVHTEHSLSAPIPSFLPSRVSAQGGLSDGSVSAHGGWQTPGGQTPVAGQTSDGHPPVVPRETPQLPLTDPAPPGSTPTGAQVRLHRMDGFRRPTVEEVAAFVAKHGLRCEPGAFIDHFTSNGWKVGGRAPMKDWQAAVRNWDRKAREGPAGAKAQRDEDDALLRRRQILTG